MRRKQNFENKNKKGFPKSESRQKNGSDSLKRRVDKNLYAQN